MSAIDIFYLSVVLVAFFGFASALAYFTQRDRLPAGRIGEASSRQETATATGGPEKIREAA